MSDQEYRMMYEVEKSKYIQNMISPYPFPSFEAWLLSQRVVASNGTVTAQDMIKASIPVGIRFEEAGSGTPAVDYTHTPTALPSQFVAPVNIEITQELFTRREIEIAYCLGLLNKPGVTVDSLSVDLNDVQEANKVDKVIQFIKDLREESKLTSV